MKLKKILHNIPVKALKGTKDIDITGISADSRCVAPGNLFIARKGLQHDGTQYALDAMDAGAIAIATDMYNPFLEGITQVIVTGNVQTIEADIAANYYGHPSKELFMVGVTGTNGKTTTTFLMKHLLEKKAHKCGLIGGIINDTGHHILPSHYTTPDAITCHKLLREMVSYACDTVAMEVTSHGLAQDRTKNVFYDIALFTNLSHDHLDFHKNFSQYVQAKKKLFESLGDSQGKKETWAIVNAEDALSHYMLENCLATHVMRYGWHAPADLMAQDVVFEEGKLIFTLHFQQRQWKVTAPLIGRYNVENILAAFCVGIARGLSIENMIESIATFPGIPGRMERVPLPSAEYFVFIDHAHTPDSLKKALETLRTIKGGRLITVFGCGGDRDPLKRKIMGEISEKLSDVTIVTSDNPRSEDPHKICEEIAQGFSLGAQYQIEIDRYEAIKKALTLAKKEDKILIAGKGHEKFQVFANKTVPFDDLQVVQELYKTRN